MLKTEINTRGFYRAVLNTDKNYLEVVFENRTIHIKPGYLFSKDSDATYKKEF
jgi:hypothetical protein